MIMDLCCFRFSNIYMIRAWEWQLSMPPLAST
uniref:Uncharacterized protein n=1 Tax=Rhizophora mucronata TaxID=61149 RepID=A0A2P2NVZ7_RHIMU